MNGSILIIDDQECIRVPYAKFLRAAGYEVECADNYRQGLESLTTQHFDLILADVTLGEATGIDLLRQIRDLHLACPLILITEYPTVQTAIEAVRLGAFDYLPRLGRL